MPLHRSKAISCVEDMRASFAARAPGLDTITLPSIDSREPSSLSIVNVKFPGATPGMLTDPASCRSAVSNIDSARIWPSMPRAAAQHLQARTCKTLGLRFIARVVLAAAKGSDYRQTASCASPAERKFAKFQA